MLGSCHTSTVGTLWKSLTLPPYHLPPHSACIELQEPKGTDTDTGPGFFCIALPSTYEYLRLHSRGLSSLDELFDAVSTKAALEKALRLCELLAIVLLHPTR